MNKELIDIGVDKITVKARCRADNGDLGALQQSIEKLGLLYPLIVDRNNVLIAGARRLEACRQAGVQTVPVIKCDISYDSMLALDIQADENLCRAPLSQQELETLIQTKKAAMGEKGAGGAPLGARFKHMFGRK